MVVAALDEVGKEVELLLSSPEEELDTVADDPYSTKVGLEDSDVIIPPAVDEVRPSLDELLGTGEDSDPEAVDCPPIELELDED